MQYLFRNEKFISAGQPSDEDFHQLFHKDVKVCVNMRSELEDDFGWERELCQQMGIEYFQLSFFDDQGEVSKENLDKVCDLFENNHSAILIHCKTANRIGAWFYYYLIQKKGYTHDNALDEAVTMGLSNLDLINRVQMLF